MTVTSRERVTRTLNHEQSDRPPVDLGSTPNTSICLIAYERLKNLLGASHDTIMLGEAFQTVQVDEEVLVRLSIDTRPVFPGPPDHNPLKRTDDGGFIDEWGIRFRPALNSEGRLLYYDMVQHPLSGATQIHDIESYKWPDPTDPGLVRGLSEKAKRLRETTEFALVGHPGDTSIFEAAWGVRGMQEFLMDLVADRPMAQAVLEKTLEVQCARYERYLEAVGDYLDVAAVGDDLGGQFGLLVSPDIYRSVIKPYHKRYFEFIKSKTPAKLKLHSCGAIVALLDDLIEIGVDIINPVQVTAAGMDPCQLKKRFGDRLVFWGGIDSQDTLPRGTRESVRQEVATRIQQLGVGGGYVVSAVHNIQADVPPENITELFDTAASFLWE